MVHLVYCDDKEEVNEITGSSQIKFIGVREMKRKVMAMIALGLLVFSGISGCTNDTSQLLKEENTSLQNEISTLEEQLEKKDDEIQRLRESNAALRAEREELKNSINLIRFSAYARANNDADTFEGLQEIYGIGSEHVIKDNWYVLQEEAFRFELLGYQRAQKVAFHLYRMESDQGEILLYTDNDPSDGWVYKNDSIGEVINKQLKSTGGGLSYEPYFVLYTVVTLADGNTVQTLKLPVYYE